jgi:hypothetical protein
MMACRRVALLWIELFLSIIGVAAALLAGISSLNSTNLYNEDRTAFEAFSFVTAALCAGLCLFPLRILCSYEEEALVRWTPYWIAYSVVTLVFGVLVLVVGLPSFDNHEYEEDIFVSMGTGVAAGMLITFVVTVLCPFVLVTALYCACACGNPRRDDRQVQSSDANQRKDPHPLVFDGQLQDINLGQDAA